MVTCFTNRNSCLNLLAPGSRITSTFNTGATNIYYTGTSQASPHVAAAAAILYQKMGASTAPADIQSWLVSHGVSVSDSATGLTFPRINLSDLSASAVPAVGWIGLIILVIFLGWRLRERRSSRNIRFGTAAGKK